jgi:hypothetical protein
MAKISKLHKAIEWQLKYIWLPPKQLKKLTTTRWSKKFNHHLDNWGKWRLKKIGHHGGQVWMVIERFQLPWGTFGSSGDQFFSIAISSCYFMWWPNFLITIRWPCIANACWLPNGNKIILVASQFTFSLAIKFNFGCHFKSSIYVVIKFFICQLMTTYCLCMLVIKWQSNCFSC